MTRDDVLTIGQTYRFWLGTGFIRTGKVLYVDQDGLVTVRWTDGAVDYVRADQRC